MFELRAFSRPDMEHGIPVTALVSKTYKSKSSLTKAMNKAKKRDDIGRTEWCEVPADPRIPKQWRDATAWSPDE